MKSLYAVLVAVTVGATLAFTVRPFSSAQAEPGTTTEAVKECQATPRLNGICSFVKDKSESLDKRYKYSHQKVILEGACVAEGDSHEVVREKVGRFWKKYEDELTCNDITFTVNHGSIIKFAVLKTNDQFIYDVSRKWGVPLNRIDKADGKTALDYIDDFLARERRAESSLISKIEMYRRFVIESGGLTSNEVIARSNAGKR